MCYLPVFFHGHYLCPSKHGPKPVKQQNKWMVVHRKIFHHTLWTMVVNSVPVGESIFKWFLLENQCWSHSNDGLWTSFHFVQPAQQVTRCLTLLITNELWVYQKPVQWVHLGSGFSDSADPSRKKTKNFLLSRQLMLVLWCFMWEVISQ